MTRPPSIACWAGGVLGVPCWRGGRPARRAGGRAWARDGGGGGNWMIRVIFQTVSQQQGPGMNILLLNTMHVSKYESAKDLAKSIFCIAYSHIQLNLDL